MKISVVIPTYNRPADLIDCLQSIRRQFEPPAEIIIVDDGEVAATQDQLQEEGFSNIEHVEGKTDGLSAARNRGVEIATGDVIAFVDDDIVLPPNWSRELRRTYERFPEAAGVGGYVLNYNPSDINKANVDSFAYRLLQGFRMAFLYDKVGNVSPIGILWAPHVFMTSGLRQVDAFQGCNMSFRAEVFELYAFDEWYGVAGSSALEEVDFGIRVSSDGGELIYNSRIVVLHKRSLGDSANERVGGPNYGNTTNLTYFVLKHSEMGMTNVLLLTLAITAYSAITYDLGHLEAVKNGIIEYWRHGRERRNAGN